MQAALADAVTLMASSPTAETVGVKATRQRPTNSASRKDMPVLPDQTAGLMVAAAECRPVNAGGCSSFHDAATKMQIPATTGRGSGRIELQDRVRSSAHWPC